MTAEFELSINNDGSPMIKFRHHDKDNSLEQKLLKVFIDKANKDGICLKPTGGYLETGTKNSWEDYIIL